MQLLSPVLCCVAASKAVCAIWAALRRHTPNLAAAQAVLNAEDVEGEAEEEEEEEEEEAAEEDAAAAKAARTAAARKLLEYAARAGAWTTAVDVEAHSGVLGGLAGASASSSFEPALAVTYTLLLSGGEGGGEGAAAAATASPPSDVASKLLPQLASYRRRSMPLRVMTALVEEVIAAELPDLHSALQRAALPAALPPAPAPPS